MRLDVTKFILQDMKATVEPEWSPIPEPEKIQEDGKQEGWPEPVPEWDVGFKEWGAAWECHVYLYGVLFFLLDVVTILLIIKNLCEEKSFKRKRLTISLLLMMAGFNSMRVVSLFIDPYSTIGVLPSLAGRLLWSSALPFLSSAFCLVLLVLMDTTKMELGPPKFMKLSTIIGLTIFHFGIVLVSDLLVFYEPNTKAFLLFCQILFILYGTILTIGYLYVAIKLRSNCAAGQLTDISKFLWLCYVSVFVGIMIIATYLYGSVGDFGVYSEVQYIDPWPWWVLQSLMRFEEVAAATIVITVTKPRLNVRLMLKNIHVCQNKCCSKNTRIKPVNCVSVITKMSIKECKICK